MSIIGAKASPEGIDIKIQSLQTKLHNNLSAAGVWNTALYDAYGRAYRVPLIDDTYRLELDLGDNEYSGDAYINDAKAATSFFYVHDDDDYENHLFKSTVDIIFFVNLTTLLSSITHRADTEVKEDIYELLRREPEGFKIQNCITGIDNVFAGMAISNIKYDDLQPYHIFKYVTNVNHR